LHLDERHAGLKSSLLVGEGVEGNRRAGSRAWSLAGLSASDVPSARPWNLTTRQTEVLNLIVRGLTNTGIAEALGIRLGTVEFHISAIFDKVGVNSRAALIATLMGI
jgi:DNA-binding NarL/FixJ family response regulator